MCEGSLHTLSFSSAPIDTNRRPEEELKESIRREIDSILEDELIRLNSHFLKRCQKFVEEGHFHLGL